MEIHSIDRLGKNTLDILKTWKELIELGIKGCGGMEIDFEGNFLNPKPLLNLELRKDWINSV